jgi:glycosyltransferase involved in cell wall biosynthesis
MRTVSVILPARNAADTLGDQLVALSKIKDEFELILVDSCSDDETVMVAEYFMSRFRHLHIVKTSKPGIATARNAGSLAASGDFLLYCDADDIVGDKWFTEMVKGLRESPIAMGSIKPFGGHRSCAPLGVNEAPNKSGFVQVPSGASGIRSELFHRLGGFDTLYDGSGNEDAEFFFRAQLNGAAVKYCPEAVIHVRERSTGRLLFAQVRGHGRGVGLMYRQYGKAALRSGVYRPPVLRTSVWALTRSPLLFGGAKQRTRWIRVVGRTLGFVEGYYKLPTSSAAS